MRIQLRTTVSLKISIYIILVENPTQDHGFSLDLNLYYLGWGSNPGLLTFLSLRIILSWVGIQLRTIVFLRFRVYTVLVRNQTHDYYLSQPTSSPSQLLTSSTLPLSGTPVDKIPPQLLLSSPPQLHGSLAPPVDKISPHLRNFTAFWRPKWTKYLLTSSTLLLSGTPSGQNTSSPPQLHCSMAPQVDKIPSHLLNSTAFGCPKWPPPCF